MLTVMTLLLINAVQYNIFYTINCQRFRPSNGTKFILTNRQISTGSLSIWFSDICTCVLYRNF